MTDSTVIVAVVSGRGARVRMMNGAEEVVTAAGGEDVRALVLRRVVAEARQLGGAVELHTMGDRGEHRLLVSPLGDVTPLAVAQAEPSAPLAREDPAAVRVAEQPLLTQSAIERDDLDAGIDERTTVSRWRLNTDPGVRWRLVFASVEVHVDDRCVIGRTQRTRTGDSLGERLQTVADPTRTMSRRHAELEPSTDGLYVTDLGSVNGTSVSVDGAVVRLVPLERTLLGVGQRLLFGDVAAELTHAEQTPPAPVLAPPHRRMS